MYFEESELMNQTGTEKKYDVAISFLIEDMTTAEALYTELSKGLQVFFYPHKQEEIAAKDGTEFFRKTFLTDSRLNVVVYRERWGTTQWTTVESNAIRDSCVQNQFRNIFVLDVENARTFPDWLPHNHMRFNLAEYPLEQVVGAIKQRVAEQGGQYEPMTPVKQAQIMKAEQEYQCERSDIQSIQNLPRIKEELERLFAEVAKQCEAINKKDGELNLECEVNVKQTCALRCEQAGMVVRWEQRSRNTLNDSVLTVEEYRGHLTFNRDSEKHVQYIPPVLLKSTQYELDWFRSREYGWKMSGKSTEFVPSVTLAQTCVMQFLYLVERQRNGKG
jgi:hypothetical protein